ncbi:MAG: hypothetical protein RLZZ393_1791 [Pseudomonadota bacterium]
MASPGDVSPYDWLVWPEGALEHALAADTRRRDVMAYLGEKDYATLAPLAREAARTRRDPERVVYIVPGIMGSQLGYPRSGDDPPDLLWVDPLDLQRGRIDELAADNTRLLSLGPAPYSHLSLKLRLEIAGFTVRWADHDWRQGVEVAGATLAARMNAEPASRQYVVAHSMGGLVARAALAGAEAGIARLVTLGTPHHGSFAALQALRASYVSVRRIAQLAPGRTTEALTERIFARYRSLYQMLPAPIGDGLDLRRADSWPDSSPRPDPALRAEAGPPALPWAEGRSCCIAGVGFDTVSAVTLEDAQFRYHVTGDGDGTVSSSSAAPDGVPAWYCSVLHGELPRDATVASAIVDLLDAGCTQALPTEPPAASRASRSITDTVLREACATKLDWSRMTAAQRREWFDGLNRPVAAGSILEDFP